MILTPSFRTALTGSSAALLIAVLPAQGGSQGGTADHFWGFRKDLGAERRHGHLALRNHGAELFDLFGYTAGFVELGGGLGLVLTRNPDGSTSSQMTTPNLSFGYDRKSASAEAKVNLGYARDQIQTVRPLSDFINSDGQLVLPTNPNDLLGTGLKQTETAGASLELGRNGPFGLTLTGGYDKTVYSQTTAPDLLDTSSASLGLKGRFSYSPVGDLTLGLATSHNTTQGASTQDITTLDLGTSYKISPVLSVSGGANYTITNDSAAGRSTSVSPTVGATYTLKDGSIAFSAAKSQASLSWQQKTADGSVSAQVSHGPGGSNGTRHAERDRGELQPLARRGFEPGPGALLQRPHFARRQRQRHQPFGQLQSRDHQGLGAERGDELSGGAIETGSGTDEYHRALPHP